MSKTRKTFGERLKAAQETAGLSIAQLAERSGLHVSTINRLRGESRKHPDGDTVVALAKALGVSADELLGLK